MQNYFQNKVIYLISPQKWGVMKVSKHHYALELAERGNKVFFIEPPDLNQRGISISKSAEHSLISIVKYCPIFRGKRFLPRFVYKLLLRIQINKLKHAIKVDPDLVWSFSGHLFEDLKWSKKVKTIFFAADLYPQSSPPPEVYNADLTFAVSNTIRDKLKESNQIVHLINHGISQPFAKIASKRISELYLTQQDLDYKPLKIGYFGNLLMQAIDIETMQQVIKLHNNITFVFWGEYRTKNSNLGENAHEEANQFIDFLKKQPNVILKGAVNTEQLAFEILDIDAFWICWKTKVHNIWDGSNSHKILEYLSTGRPVISHYISAYDGNNLFYMLPTNDNKEYINLFQTAIKAVEKGESTQVIQSRIETALNNTYASHLDRISKLLLESPSKN